MKSKQKERMMTKKLPFVSPLEPAGENIWQDKNGKEYSVVRDHGGWVVQVPCNNHEGRAQAGFVQWYDYTFHKGTLEVLLWLNKSGATHLNTREEAIMLLGMYILACEVDDKGLSSGRTFPLV